jgi:hypothetical protein
LEEDDFQNQKDLEREFAKGIQLNIPLGLDETDQGVRKNNSKDDMLISMK